MYRSGRCSPVSRISRMRSKYWCSSWVGSTFAGVVPLVDSILVWTMNSASVVEGAIFVRFYVVFQFSSSIEGLMKEEDAMLTRRKSYSAWLR